MNAIEIRDLQVRQDDFNLSIDAFDIPEGYITGLIGENGAGKTSLIYQLLNLRTPEVGIIRILGMDYRTDREKILAEIGVVFSENHFPEWMSPKKLEAILKINYAEWNHEEYMRYLKQFAVPYEKKIKNFSQGMKVKLSLAAALSHNARLLILDEPTSNLDPTFRLELLHIFQELMLNEDRTILFSTHITSDLENVADYIAFIEEGQLAAMDEKERLVSRYQIVRGQDMLLDDELVQLLIGLEVRDGSFVGMTEDGRTFEELFGHKVNVRNVTIDEFMYFKKKERVGGKVNV